MLKFDGYLIEDKPGSYVSRPYEKLDLDMNECMCEHSEPTPVLKVEPPSHVTYYELPAAPKSKYELRNRKPRVHKPKTSIYVPYDIKGKVRKIIPHR
jgi:hypothetical protein